MVFDAQVDASTAGPSTPDDRLLAILAAAAPFEERVAGEYFTPVRGPGRQLLAKRTTRWLRAAVGDDPAARRALLLHRRRTGRDLGAGLVDVAVRDPDRLPDWARAFVAFLDAQPANVTVDPACELVGGAFVAFQRAAARLVGLRPDATTVAGVALTDGAGEQVAGQLVQRLTAGCHAALAFEVQVAEGSAAPLNWFGRADIDVSRNGWLARAESLPGLAYVVGVTCLHWQRTVTELFDRLRTDLPLLRRELWGWADPGPLAAYSGDSGDLHHHGRVVTVLTFAGGQRVVYKPKDLSSAAGFMDVLAFLNRHGLPLELATRKVLRRDGYGWEEFVTAAPDVDAAGAGRFYTRLGMLARLAEFLECRDLWLDNLLAAGEQPVFIDLETVLHGRMRRPVTIGTRAAALSRRAGVRRTSAAARRSRNSSPSTPTGFRSAGSRRRTGRSSTASASTRARTPTMFSPGTGRCRSAWPPTARRWPTRAGRSACWPPHRCATSGAVRGITRRRCARPSGRSR
jgi:hypothetical protein